MITGENRPRNKYIYEELYEWENITSIAAGFGQTVGVKKDGHVVAIGFIEENKRDGAREWRDIRVKEIQ